MSNHSVYGYLNQFVFFYKSMTREQRFSNTLKHRPQTQKCALRRNYGLTMKNTKTQTSIFVITE